MANHRLITTPARSALACFFWLVLVACGPNRNEPLRLGGETMGTTWSLVISQSAGQQEARLQSAIEAELVSVNDLASTWQSDSELSQLNQNTSTDWVSVSEALYGLLEQAQLVSEASGGAFDVTVGPLVNLWGFGPDKELETIPSDEAIAAAQALSGRDAVALRAQPPAVRKSASAVYIDLSASAKGYGVDRVTSLLDQRGITDYLFEIGGELRASGKSPRGDAWKIGVERPIEGERVVHAAVTLDNGALATSGDYRNFFERDGVRYSHTIDPRTGKPITHRLASVSVFASTSAASDAWATALMVLGEDAGYDLAESRGLAAYFLYKDGGGFKAKVTTAFQPLLNEDPT